jgi:DNA-directed RNA polymerase subunit RPC12/RpoP
LFDSYFWCHQFLFVSLFGFSAWQNDLGVLMSGYDIGGGYDGWRTATPWDDEVAFNVTYVCSKCQLETEDAEAVGSKGSDEVIVFCDECGAENSVDVGGE